MPKKIDKLEKAQRSNFDAKQKIVNAAIKCFEQYGPQRTSMADIAEAAGISRKTLYRIFEDRASLIEQVLAQRLSILGNKVQKQCAIFIDFEEGIVEGSIASINAARRDKLFNEIVQQESNRRIERFLFRGTDQIFSDMCDIWFPLIEEGRKQQRVRKDLSNERIIEIIISIHALLLMRDDYGVAKQRGFLNDVLLPAITGVA